MKILIINQHTSNHGDEAAGKALLRGIRNLGITDKIGILYNVNELLDIEKFKMDDNIDHYVAPNKTFIDKLLGIATFFIPFRLIKHFYRFGSFTKYEYELIDKYDKIINAPGGVNIGPYKDWLYIWRLYIALKMKKDVAIYSISFGPIPDTYLFDKASKYILSNVKFLSLRDNKSQQYAKELNIDYIKSIDTAFLNNQPLIDVPKEILKSIGDNYVVVVPNELNRWHPNFKSINPSKLNDIYLKIINYFLDKNLKVVLLPQLFGLQNDSKYFEVLKKQTKKQESVMIIDDIYNSEIQQKIISGAKFLVGARYHTIIFSVNNKRPFLALAYEHKMTNTLELIDLADNNVILQDIIDDKIDILDLLDAKYNQKDEIQTNVINGSKKANAIATETLELLHKFLSVK
jgi:colanic acid/amylovoran biosynthesis protein